MPMKVIQPIGTILTYMLLSLSITKKQSASSKRVICHFCSTQGHESGVQNEFDVHMLKARVLFCRLSMNKIFSLYRILPPAINIHSYTQAALKSIRVIFASNIGSKHCRHCRFIIVRLIETDSPISMKCGQFDKNGITSNVYRCIFRQTLFIYVDAQCL